MRAAWYECQGEARDVLVVGEMPDPDPGPGDVRIRMAVSGVNPGDVKKRRDEYGYGMSYPRVIPHSDGAGEIDRVGAGVSESRVGERVWCYGAQSYRPFGTAAEYCLVPSHQAVYLADRVPLEQGACVGIPGITAHRAVHAGGPVGGQHLLVHGGAGAVGLCAVRLASHAGATVIATVRHEADEPTVRQAGAAYVIRAGDDLAARVRAIVPDGVHHVIDVALDANIGASVDALRLGGSIAAYASGSDTPAIPFWPLVFKNVRVTFLGSDDFPTNAKRAAATALSDALAHGWEGLPIAHRVPLRDIAHAHELVEDSGARGRIVVTI